jgi:hypothetical protein
VELSDRLRGTDLAERVNEYEPILHKEIGAMADVEWDVREHQDYKGRHQLILRMKEKHGPLKGEARAFFDHDELGWREHMLRRLTDIKGSLERIGEWRESLEGLYRQIREWCQAAAPAWIIEERPITVEEVRPGEYQSIALRIVEGSHAVDVRPIGHQIVGADGRVDLEGEENRQILLLSHREGGWLWLDDRTVVRLRPLTGDLFIDLVRDCMG